MDKLIFAKIYCSIVVCCLILNFPLKAAGEFGGVFVDNLNFTHKVRVRSASDDVEIKTGSEGNVLCTDGKPFDINAIHTQLHQSTEKARREVLGAGSDAPNAVMAGLTLIIRFGDRFEAFYQQMPEVFRSGSVETPYNNKQITVIGPSAKYQPIGLLQKFKGRLNDDGQTPAISGRDKVAELYKSWENKQKDVLRETLSHQQKVLQETLDQTSQLLETINSADSALALPAVFSVAEKLDEIRKNATKTAGENFG